MNRTIDEHAARFDAKAATYDEGDRPIYQACLDAVIAAANPDPTDVVLDLGAGTGAIALALAPHAKQVIGRDISEEMLTTAREKAQAQELENVSFGSGRFREPNYDGSVDIITSNYALHHLDDEAKAEAITAMAAYEPKRVVLGDLMFFENVEPPHPGYDPAVDDPAYVGRLASAFTNAGFVITDVVEFAPHVGVIVARWEG